MQKVIIMKKYTQEEREAAIRELEETPIKPDEWEGPHKTKVTSFNLSLKDMKKQLHCLLI